MKYTILINQVGIVDAGLADKTDFSDWAILEYIFGWQAHSSAMRCNDHVWINYSNLLLEIPMLGVKSRAGVSRRISRLRDLGLLSTIQAEDNRLFIKITDFYLSVVHFRPNSLVINEHVPSKHPVATAEHPVEPPQHPVATAEHPVEPPQHILNNNINNNKQTKHNAGDADEKGTAYDDGHVFVEPMHWAQFFIQTCGYPFHIVQTSKTIPMFAKWVSEQTTVGEIRQAMAACHGWNGNRIADSPMLYGKFLQSIRDERRRLDAESVFAGRPGVGKSRCVEDWERIPRDDAELVPWMARYGYGVPLPGHSFQQARAYVRSAVERRKKEREAMP